MNIFRNTFLFIKFIPKVFALNSEKGAYHSHVKKLAKSEIEASHILNDGNISKLNYLKIQWYMATNLYLGELLAELRQQKLTLEEEKSFIYLGALMAITDMMVDDHKIDSKKVSDLMKGNYNSTSEPSSIEKVFVLYHNHLIENIDDSKAKFILDFNLRKPQIESETQLKGESDESEIHELTRKKGGTAILLAASLLFDIDENMKAAFYQLGAFIQYMNDSQDMFKDKKAGITTFVSFCNTFDEISENLKHEFDTAVGLFLQTRFDLESLYKFMFQIHALYVGIQFKNQKYKSIIGHELHDASMLQITKEKLHIQMISLAGLNYCLPKILLFRM